MPLLVLTLGLSPIPALGNETVPESVHTVTTTGELRTALKTASPGETIELADGVYVGNFKVTNRPGTADEPITLTGSADAVLRTNTGGGNVLHLNGSAHWIVNGLTFQHGQKGVMVDASDHVTLDAITVHDLKMEGVHFRTSSSYGTVSNSKIFDTGKNGRGMGEGIYVGTANNYSDQSDNVQILDNVIGPDVRGESIDIKEGTRNGLISGNTFYGQGMTGVHYDDSWVDIKGNDYVVENNTGYDTLKAGFQTHQQSAGWGCGTIFRNNSSDLRGAQGTGRFAIDVTVHDAQACPVTVTSDNTVIGGDGLTNPGIPVTPAGGDPVPDPTTEPSPDPTTDPGEPGECAGLQWNSSDVYTAGDTVTYGSDFYTAKWWTLGQPPSSTPWGPWARTGNC